MLLCLALSVLGSTVEAQPASPPSAGPVLPNATLITAKVLKHSIWNTILLHSAQPDVLYSLVLEIRVSEGVGDMANLVSVGDRVEAFSKEALSPDLFGKTVRATIRLRGDEWGQRFWIQKIHSVGD